MVVDLADEFDTSAREERFDLRTEIDLVDAVHLGCDLERDSQRPRDRDGAVRAFLRRDAAEKGKIAAVRLGRAMQAYWDAVEDGAHKMNVRYGATLGVGDRDQRHVVEPRIKRVQIREVLAPVQRGHSAARDVPKQGEMELIDVKMQDVKLVGSLADAIEHQHIIRDRIAHAGVETKRLRDARNEIGRGD